MRIGIDIRKYFDFGIGTYIQNLIAEFQNERQLELTYFAADEQKILLENNLRGNFVSENSSKYSVRELFALSKKVNTLPIDLLHMPHYTLPINLKKKNVVTIHDLIHIRLPEYFSLVQRMYALFMLRHACANSSHIIVVSEYTKNDILKSFDISEDKITVIPNGIDPIFLQKRSLQEKTEFKQRFNISKPYVLYTGSFKPHKNISLLMDAFKLIRKAKDIQLVLTGEKIKEYPGILSTLDTKELVKNVISVGYLSSKDLVTVYQCAQAVVLPSVYEGFGFSMIEAMASGVPAMGADATSIPEIVGNGGVLFDIHDPEDLANKFLKIMSNEGYRNNLVALGTERVKRFSWEQCARQTIDVYKKTLQ